MARRAASSLQVAQIGISLKNATMTVLNNDGDDGYVMTRYLWATALTKSGGNKVLIMTSTTLTKKTSDEKCSSLQNMHNDAGYYSRKDNHDNFAFE